MDFTLFMMHGIGSTHAFPMTNLLNPASVPLSSSSFKVLSLNLGSNGSRATGFSQWALEWKSAIHPHRQVSGFEPITILVAKGYKMKT